MTNTMQDSYDQDCYMVVAMVMLHGHGDGYVPGHRNQAVMVMFRVMVFDHGLGHPGLGHPTWPRSR